LITSSLVEAPACENGFIPVIMFDVSASPNDPKPEPILLPIPDAPPSLINATAPPKSAVIVSIVLMETVILHR